MPLNAKTLLFRGSHDQHMIVFAHQIRFLYSAKVGFHLAQGFTKLAQFLIRMSHPRLFFFASASYGRSNSVLISTCEKP